MATTGSPLRVYTLDGLPPEVAAVTFAKTSRVPDSFDAIARELTEADSSRFHEKWVIGYGHSSVAEHAVLSIAIENISILGAKVVEENRLSSFTEKSTRYQVMDPSNFYTPPEFENVGAYRESVGELYATYTELLPRTVEFCGRKYGGAGAGRSGLNPAGKACDAVRGLLPAAAKTNLGWTVNARSLRHAIVKLRSHPLAEMRDLADAVEGVCGAVVPTLLKYTEPSLYLMERASGGRPAGDAASGGRDDVGCGPGERDVLSRTGPSVRLVTHDPDGQRKVAAALLFGASNASYAEAVRRAAAMNEDEVGVLLEGALREIGSHEAPVREFESTAYTFEIVCDFGAYRDVQRHRMTTQIQQTLGCGLGHSIPGDAREAGVAGRMEDALERAAERWLVLSREDPHAAQYAVPLAFHKRFLMQMNYREAYVFVRLRSKVHGHESYRRIAWAVKDEIERAHPVLGGLIPAEREQARCAVTGG
ncbi:MAG: FAD-dependent thymidylate synthase [Candidatus Eisenbacteria bacterium]